MDAAEDLAPRDFNAVSEDLKVPEISEGEPAAGKRVRLTAPGFEGTAVHHTIYLPPDWQAGQKYPVLFEYAGNGGYKNNLGDACDGTVESCHLGYGISGGRGFIWVCLPFVEIVEHRSQNAIRWWGEVSETLGYCHSAVAQTCEKFGGDKEALVLCGFSRGAIACNFIGLYDDRIAKHWRAFLAYSNYDGVRINWPYAGADRASALARLKRLNGRPQFISAEMQTADIETYITQAAIKGDFTFVPIPFPNHNDRWALRDIPQRRLAREWLARVLKKP